MHARIALLIVAAIALNTFAGTVTFNKDIAPLMFKNCSGCHRPGEVAPFSLLTYDDAKKKSAQMVKVTQKRYMPPWKPEPGHGEFSDSRRLTDAQVALIKQWADEGAVEGRTADLPLPPKFSSEWSLGKPDLVLEMKETYTIPAEGRDIYRCFVVPVGNTEEKYVSAVEFRPGNRKVVHHVLMFLDDKGMAKQKDAADPAPGYAGGGGPGFIPYGGLGGWAPGSFAKKLQDGMSIVLPKNADIVLQEHFSPSGKEETEKSTVALYFSKKPPTKVVFGTGLGSINIDIPAGKKDHKISASVTLPVDTEFVGITPHAHLVCTETKANYTLPGSTLKKSLIWIKDWDFEWQDQYQFKTPLKLPKGTKIDMEFTYDNSESNPRNPNTPPKRVKVGEQTTDEMAILFLNAAVKDREEGMQLVQAMISGQIADNVDRIRNLPPEDQQKAIQDALKAFGKQKK